MKPTFKCSVEPKTRDFLSGHTAKHKHPGRHFCAWTFSSITYACYIKGSLYITNSKKGTSKHLLEGKSLKNFHACALFHCPPKWVMSPSLALCSEESPGTSWSPGWVWVNPPPGCTSGNGWHIFLLKGWWPKRNFPGWTPNSVSMSEANQLSLDASSSF